MRDYPLCEAPAMDDIPLSSGMRIIIILMRTFSTGGMREIGGPCDTVSILYAHDLNRDSTPLSSSHLPRRNAQALA